ncbi:MAG TPA: hypothetical protein PK147_01950 [Saprospiraceae bacterium]|nr:hypothetical protein [Saprospiraceae bacterium]MCB9329368.1 hypothetical protein [Lewinellaceae bacterium]HPQ20580.1 hypothetical protein [Saprospiraceae bacterium]HRX27749.1 hypothetical protein [Saprospiraceae bacterium]
MAKSLNSKYKNILFGFLCFCSISSYIFLNHVDKTYTDNSVNTNQEIKLEMNNWSSELDEFKVIQVIFNIIVGVV